MLADYSQAMSMFGLGDVMDARLKDSDDEDDEEDDDEERPARIHIQRLAKVPCDTH